MSEPRFLGRTVALAGGNYVVPTLSVKQIRHYFSKGSKTLQLLASVQGLPTAEQTDALIEVCAAALSRNYPEINAAWLADNLGPSELTQLVLAVLQESGLQQTPAA